MPDPLQEGSRRLRLVRDGQQDATTESSLHVGNSAIFFVREICGEEIPFGGFNVSAPGTGKHRV